MPNPQKIRITPQNIFTLFEGQYNFKSSELKTLDYSDWCIIAKNKSLTPEFFTYFKKYLSDFIYEIINLKRFSVNFLLQKENIKLIHNCHAISNLCTNYHIKNDLLIKYWKIFRPDVWIVFQHQKLTKKFIEAYIEELTKDKIIRLFLNYHLKFDVLNLVKEKFPGINVEDINWGRWLSPQMVKLAMAYDAQHHSKPELFDEWAKGGDCPYLFDHDERKLYFCERKELWQPKLKTIKLPSKEKLFDLFAKDVMKQAKKRVVGKRSN